MFTIEICAYALMSNHYHLVLKVDKDKADTLSDHDVALRKKQLFSGHIMVDRWLTNKIMIQVKENKALELIKTWRTRKYDLGWQMRCLNIKVAVQVKKKTTVKAVFAKVALSHKHH